MFPDHIVCLEDGNSFKTLRRHLQNVLGGHLTNTADAGTCPAKPQGQGWSSVELAAEDCGVDQEA